VIIDVDYLVPSAIKSPLLLWSAAEFTEWRLPDGLTLRAVVCRTAADRWQWSISSLAQDRGELICSGVEKSNTAARDAAASEITKCLENPMG
jgi:hypothetical protein